MFHAPVCRLPASKLVVGMKVRKRNSSSVELDLEIIEYLGDHLVVLQGSDCVRDVSWTRRPLSASREDDE